MKINFFNTVLKTCTKVSSFVELQNLSLRRIFAYQLFLVFLLSCGIGLSNEKKVAKKIDEISNIFITNFEGVKVSDNKLVLFKNNDKVADSIGGDFKFNYYPSIKDLDDSWSKNNELQSGIIFMPTCVIVWQRDSEKKYVMIPMVFRGLRKDNKYSYSFINAMKASAFIRKLAEKKGSLKVFVNHKNGEIKANENINMAQWVKYFKQLVFPSLVISAFWGIILFSEFLVLIFSSFTAFWSRKTPLEWKFVHTLKINILVGFPGMIITALYLMAGVMTVDFTTVLLICFVVYNFAVFRYLTRERLKENL